MKASRLLLLKWALPLLAVSYLCVALAGSDLPQQLSLLDIQSLAVAAAAAPLYGAALYLLAGAWAASLYALAPKPVDLVAALRLYAFSTFAKYLPGNVFHYAGRQLAAGRLGYGQKAPAQATVLEIAGHLLTAGCLLGLLVPFASGWLAWLRAATDLIGAFWWPVFFAAIALAAAGSLVLAGRGSFLLPAVNLRMLLLVAVLQVGFFCFSTLLGVWLAMAALGVPEESLPAVAFAYLLAWLVGFVTPGAPGGLGVREACLVATLQGIADPAAILAFAALSRASLLVGEGLFALSSVLLRPRVGAARRA